jgi:DNA-binding NarL/FixJ family response regulator
MALRVLLVEDSRVLTERVSETLAALDGVDLVATASDEAAAVASAREQDVDVMILDLQLRSGTGFGVLKQLGRKRPVVIVFTNYMLPQYQRRAADLGVEHFLSKSRDYERLPMLLQELEQRQRAAAVQ